MKMLLFATLILAVFASLGVDEASAQQAPFLSELNARTEEMNRLAAERGARALISRRSMRSGCEPKMPSNAAIILLC